MEWDTGAGQAILEAARNLDTTDQRALHDPDAAAHAAHWLQTRLQLLWQTASAHETALQTGTAVNAL